MKFEAQGLADLLELDQNDPLLRFKVNVVLLIQQACFPIRQMIFGWILKCGMSLKTGLANFGG
ncbi:hypothetical protein P4S72_13875 [Vibrio sp. PP-XX7]